MQQREGGFSIPTMRGFNEDGMPDGSEPFFAAGPSGPTTSQFMTPAEFTTSHSVSQAGVTGAKAIAGEERRWAWRPRGARGGLWK